MLAAEKDDILLLQRLIQLGADPYTTNLYGKNALHYAVKKRQYNTTQYLITQLQFNLKTKAQYGITPFMIAVQNGDIKMIELLLQLGADPNCRTNDRPHPSAIHIAAQKGYTPIIQILIQHGADPHATDHQGRNALHYAKDPQTAHFLISALHLNPNIQDHHGNTPLLITRQNRNTHTAKTLIQLGAHPNIPNHQGQTHTPQPKRNPLKKLKPSTITL